MSFQRLNSHINSFVYPLRVITRVEREDMDRRGDDRDRLDQSTPHQCLSYAGADPITAPTGTGIAGQRPRFCEHRHHRDLGLGRSALAAPNASANAEETRPGHSTVNCLLCPIRSLKIKSCVQKSPQQS